MTVKTFYQVFPYHDNDDEATCLGLMDFNSDLINAVFFLTLWDSSLKIYKYY